MARRLALSPLVLLARRGWRCGCERYLHAARGLLWVPLGRSCRRGTYSDSPTGSSSWGSHGGAVVAAGRWTAVHRGWLAPPPPTLPLPLHPHVLLTISPLLASSSTRAPVQMRHPRIVNKLRDEFRQQYGEVR